MWNQRSIRRSMVTLVAAMAGVFVAGCEREASSVATPAGTAKPASATSPPAPNEPVPPPAPTEPPTGPASMEFSTLVHDFGAMPETETRTARLAFRNMGGAVLNIEEIKTSCGCTAASLAQRQYAPGEAGVIEVNFHPSAPGEQKQTVTVFTDASPEPVRVTIKADVQAFVIIEPRMVKLGQLAWGEPHTTSITVDSVDPDFAVTNLFTSNAKVRARLLAPSEAPSDGSARTVEITIAPDAPWGNLHSWLEVTIEGSPAPGAARMSHTAKVRVQGQVFGDLVAVPDSFRFGAAPGEAFERRLRISSSSGLPFDLQATVTQSDLDGATIDVQRLGDNEYELIFSTQGSTRYGQLRGTVTVTTDVAGEETFEIPIIGVVRNPPR